MAQSIFQLGENLSPVNESPVGQERSLVIHLSSIIMRFRPESRINPSAREPRAQGPGLLPNSQSINGPLLAVKCGGMVACWSAAVAFGRRFFKPSARLWPVVSKSEEKSIEKQ